MQIPNIYFCGVVPAVPGVTGVLVVPRSSSGWCFVAEGDWGQGAAWSPALCSTSCPCFGCSPRETRSRCSVRRLGAIPAGAKCDVTSAPSISPSGGCGRGEGRAAVGVRPWCVCPRPGGFAFPPLAQPHRWSALLNLTAPGN